VDSFSCEECRAIAHELRDAAREARRRRPGRTMTPQDLIAWLQELDEDDCARMRETSSLWKTWRRLREHRTLTGHSPSDAMVNRN